MAGGKVAARKRKRTNTGVQKENIITNGRRNTPLTLFQRQTEVNDSRDVNPEEVNSLQSLSSHSNVTSVPTPGDRPVSFSEETATPVSLLDHEPSPPAPSQPPLPRQQHPLLRSLETTYAVSEGVSSSSTTNQSDNSFITAAPLSPVPPVVSEHTSEQLDFAANNLLNQTSNLIPLRKQKQMLTFDPEDIYTWEKFETDVGMYIYTVNVFPDTAESNEAADNLAIKYTSAIIDFEKYDYEADKVIQSEFRRLMPLKRTSAHEQVKTKATKYQFPRDLLPTGFRTHRSKKQLFYLIDRLRFARERYSDNGTLLQSQFISDILFQVFFNERGRGGPRVSPTPNLIPLALICITFTMIYFHLCKSCNHPQATEKNTMFTANSYWRDVYDNYLHRRTSETRNIDWDRISEYHTNVIRGLQGRTHNEALDTTNAAETELRLYDGISDNDMID